MNYSLGNMLGRRMALDSNRIYAITINGYAITINGYTITTN